MHPHVWASHHAKFEDDDFNSLQTIACEGDTHTRSWLSFSKNMRFNSCSTKKGCHRFVLSVTVKQWLLFILDLELSSSSILELVKECLKTLYFSQVTVRSKCLKTSSNISLWWGVRPVTSPHSCHLVSICGWWRESFWPCEQSKEIICSTFLAYCSTVEFLHIVCPSHFLALPTQYRQWYTGARIVHHSWHHYCQMGKYAGNDTGTLNKELVGLNVSLGWTVKSLYD